MDNLAKINSVPFLNIFAKLGIQTEKDTTVNEYKIQIPGDGRISNGSYKLNTQKNAVYANGQDRPSGGPFYFVRKTLNTIDDREVYKWFEDNFGIKSELAKPKKNIPKKQLLEKLTDYLIGTDFSQEKLGAIKTWLVNRGFTHEYVNSEEGLLKIKEVFKTIGYCENPGTKQDKNKKWISTKPVLIFPALNEHGKIIGAKLRKINNLPEDESEKTTKSINITGSHSGIIYHSLSVIQNSDSLIIVEGEPDYIVMRMLGYNNVIGNLGGVGACKDIIRSLIKMTNTIIVAYDNDQPGKMGAKNLAKYCKREMFYIKYIDRKNVHGDPYKDINEFFEGGFGKSDFDRMISKSFVVKTQDNNRGDYSDKASKIALTMSKKDTFIFLRSKFDYYDVLENRIVRKDNMCDWLKIDTKELKEKLASGEIPTYYDVCYWKGGKKDHYNILDEQIILHQSEKPEIHPDIKFLIENLCGYKKENIEWIHKAILYKYINLNDVLVPAVLFKGVGGSGKGTFLKLLTKIFSSENVMCGLGTQSLISEFCPYNGNKLVVEINELGGGNHKDATRILDKLKSLIFESRIMINQKGIQPREVGNIAWFIMSSNHAKPIQLDSSSSGNRRFTIINTGPGIPGPRGRIVNETISKKENVANYLAWLFQTYPEVLKMDCITALENDDKAQLTEQSESITDKFFEWIDQKFPEINKITVQERNALMVHFRISEGEEHFNFDPKYTIRFFNQNLPHHVQKKKLSIRGKSINGYLIQKTLGTGKLGYFPTDKYHNAMDF